VVAGPEHGIEGDDVRVRRLRAEPPAAALRWVESALNGVTVRSVASQPGGASASMHRVTVSDAAGHHFEVMLRRYLDIDEESERSPVVHEASALTHMASSPVPTPELLAMDPDGTDVGAPALLMSMLEGRPRWDATGRRYWAQDLAELAATIHAHAPSDPATSRAYRPYRQASYDPPRWATDPDMWARAVVIFHEPPPLGQTFIHRDFYPGNLLWRRRQLTGVVDWEHACIGPPDVDIGHCRLNFLYETPDLAHFLADAWHQVTGTAYDPWADIAAIVGLLDALRRHPPGSAAKFSIEDTLSRAVAAISSR